MSSLEIFEDLHFSNGTETSDGQPFPQQILGYKTFENLILYIYFLTTCPLSLMGVLTNIANSIVYCKMGFAESSNVNFLVLSGFDFFVSLTSFLARGLYNPVFYRLSSGPLLRYMGHCLSHAMTVVMCGSAMMSALISTERCVCVVFPLKVKTLLSRRRSLYLTLTIVAYHVAFLILLYSDPGPPYDAHPQKLSFYYFYLYVIPSTASFFIVVFTTIILVIKIRKNQQWRKETISSQSDKGGDKEDRLVRTIIAISTLFIICSFPNVAIFITQMFYPSFHYANPFLGTLVQLMFSITGVFQAFSSSVNIFFYYNMSSKYKKVFVASFSCRRAAKTDGSYVGQID